MGDGLQMLVRQVQIDEGRFQPGVSQQDLKGSQISTRFEPMRGPAVTKAVRGESFGEASGWGGGAASVPDGMGTDGYVGTSVGDGSGEKISLRFHPAPVDAQSFQ